MILMTGLNAAPPPESAPELNAVDLHVIGKGPKTHEYLKGPKWTIANFDNMVIKLLDL